MAEHRVTIVAEAEDEAAKVIIERAVTATLESEGIEQKCDVCIMLTDDSVIHELNLEYRNADKPTDVLSFPMLELMPGQKIEASPLELDPETGSVMLGDIVISLDRAQVQAEKYGHAVSRELSFLTVHGMLHLLGYDHERSEEDEHLHFTRQEEILKELGERRY